LKKEYLNYLENMPDPDQPAGHRKLPDNERKQTLALLEESKLNYYYYYPFIYMFNLIKIHLKAQKKLGMELNALPIRNDTLKIRTLKGNIEKKMVEVEEAIKIFSKTKVFVKLDQ
jgi:hypothetical protein